MRTWVNKRCCAIWHDHCRHDAKRRVRNCRQPRPIPELPSLLEWSRRMALVSPRAGECFDVGWAGESGLFISHVFSFAARGCLVLMHLLLLAALILTCTWRAQGGARVFSYRWVRHPARDVESVYVHQSC